MREHALPTNNPSGSIDVDKLLTPKIKGHYGKQNLTLIIAQIIVWAFILTAIDSVESWLFKIPLVIFFCIFMQGVFSMMHEFFHANAHSNPKINYLIGLLGSLIFITAPTFHRINHWGHHMRNRTPSEQGEFIHPGESTIGKITIYYVAILGGLWFSSLIFPLASLFIPYKAIDWLSRSGRFNTYSAAFQQFKLPDWNRMRKETLLLIIFWATLIKFEVFSEQTLILCYLAFAFSWSSLQWIYHLRTPLDVVEGAYNLRLPTPIRWLFLNFNCNLTHHRQFYLPWQELYTNSNQAETQPLWYRWLWVFHWPIHLPEDLSFLEKRYF
jgi:fatty acid desaturase